MNKQDIPFMKRAIALANNGQTTARPNPCVGCVLVNQGDVVGAGWHVYSGGPHAEIYALEAAGQFAKGATAYITLEPCVHHGKTGPCCQALLDAGIERVVIASLDPNPVVSGKGVDLLRSKGIVVDVGVCEQEANKINDGFFKRMRTLLPYVRCKMAMSLDGKCAAANGESQWITGEMAREAVQALRAQSGAIVTGIGTVIEDDPQLTIRTKEIIAQAHFQRPLRMVLDSCLRIPLNARVLANKEDGQTFIVTKSKDEYQTKQLESKGTKVISFSENESNQISLPLLLKWLGEKEINDVLVEAGPALSGSFINAGLVDELILFIAPSLLGNEAKDSFYLPQLKKLTDKIEFKLSDMEMFGQDIRLILKKR